MAVDMFLKLKDIKGESKDGKGHKDEIDIFSWNFGVQQQGSFGMAGGGGAGKVQVQDIHIMKKVDKATSKLFLCCCKGDHIPEGTLTIRKAGGEALEYLKIDIYDIIVSSVQTQGAAGGDEVTESITINFAKFKQTYTEQTAKGSGGTPDIFGWNVKENTPV